MVKLVYGKTSYDLLKKRLFIQYKDDVDLLLSSGLLLVLVNYLVIMDLLGGKI